MDSQVASQLAAYDFYHCIELEPGVITPGIENLIPLQAPIMDELRRHDLRAKRVLDIGCRDGLFSFAAERMGAGAVIGIDNDLSPAAVKFLIPYFNSSVQMRSQNIYDLDTVGGERFDFVIFAGVLYHLREPFLGLRRISQAMNEGGDLLLETALLLSNDTHPMMYCPAPADSPYEPTSVTFFNHKGLISALTSLGFDEIECRGIFTGETPYFPNRQAWLSTPRGAACSTARDIVIGRGTYICRKTCQLDTTLDDYWFKTHNLNSNHEANRSFLSTRP